MTADDFKAFIVTLAPKPAYNLVFIDVGSVDVDAVREFCCGPVDESTPEATFLFTAVPINSSLSDHIFVCHGLAANTTLFVAEGTFLPEQKSILEELGFTVLQIVTNGRPIGECLMTKEK